MPVIKKENCYIAPSADIIGNGTSDEDVNV